MLVFVVLLACSWQAGFVEEVAVFVFGGNAFTFLFDYYSVFGCGVWVGEVGVPGGSD
jgi:nucleoside recognition membrane protein YjiH